MHIDHNEVCSRWLRRTIEAAKLDADRSLKRELVRAKALMLIHVSSLSSPAIIAGSEWYVGNTEQSNLLLTLSASKGRISIAVRSVRELGARRGHKANFANFEPYKTDLNLTSLRVTRR